MLRSLLLVAAASVWSSAHCHAQKARDQKAPAASERTDGDVRNTELTRCMAAWDAGTHLTRQRWAEICQEQHRASERAGRLR
jgi:hypothetical protein